MLYPIFPGRAATLIVLAGGLLAVAGCENYDAANFNRFDPASPVQRAAPVRDSRRSGGGAFALPDGRVLVTGGQSDKVIPADPNTAELYDPAADTWHYVAAPLRYHSFPAGGAVADGRVLLVGDEVSSTSPQQQPAEIYNPTTNTWTVVAGSGLGGAAHPAGLTLPGTNRVLVTCGYGLAEFDLTTNTQRIIPGGGDGSYWGALARLPDGRVLAVYPESWALFDPMRDVIVTTGRLPRTRWSGGAVAGPDGRVYVAGGREELNVNARPVRIYDVFDPTTLTFLDALKLDGDYYRGYGGSNGGMFQAGGRIVYMSIQSGTDLVDLTGAHALYGVPLPGAGASCQLPDGRIFTAKTSLTVVTDLTKYPSH